MTISKLAWGILGCGNIAKSLAKAINESTTGRLLAVASRTQDKADQFGQEFGAERRYGSYDALLADKDVQAIYIALPNHLHAEWTVKCAQAGKHILCEKPLATNLAEAMVMLEAVRRAGVFFLEAFMYRCHPATAKLVELVKDKTIGEVRLIQAQFSYNMGPQYENIRLSNQAAGGGIMDVGCYAVSMARLIAGAALGQHVAEPVTVKGVAHVGPVSRVDEWAAAALVFPGDITATCLAGTQCQVDSTLRIFGSQGSIQVPAPWFPSWGPGEAKMIMHKAGEKQPQEIVVKAEHGLYVYEVDVLAKHLADKQAPPPCMTWADSLGQQKTLDRWRRDAGMSFDREKPECLWPPTFIEGKKLKPVPGVGPAMKYGQIPGVGKPLSRLVLGTMGHVTGTSQAACAMLDQFVEMGGNGLDTAWVYGTEAVLGRWLAARGVREQLVIIGKGAHPPHVSPQGITRTLNESLQRMGVDYFDLWLMHRDDPEVPVGEFVDVLDEHQKAGRIRAFGGSNWTPQRLDEANAYAKSRGLAGFVASSPNLALAVWNEPMWGGCVSASDAASRQWYRRTRMPLLAWSSQASGFLAGGFKPEDRGNPALREVVRVWFNEDNFRRLGRIKELAAKKRCTPLQIALAWVLAQPFPTWALIGPQTIDEMRESFGALEVTLSEAESAWLNLEA